MIFALVSILSLIGTILNIKKNRYCFLFWAGTNLVWCVSDVILSVQDQKFLSRALMFFIYFWLAVYGWFSWKKNSSRGERKFRSG